MTLSRVDEKVIRVCVIPQRTKEATGENALCTPLTVTGTVDELDREFAVQLSGYTTAVVKLGSNLSAIEAAHSAALKTVEEENKKDLDGKRGKASGSKTTSSAPESKAAPASKYGKPVFGAKGGESSAAAPTLFDAPPEAAEAVARQCAPPLTGAPAVEPVGKIDEASTTTDPTAPAGRPERRARDLAQSHARKRAKRRQNKAAPNIADYRDRGNRTPGV